jgi:hypothetical protein
MTPSNADIVIDGRGLEPPEPLVRTLEALDQIGPAESSWSCFPMSPTRSTAHCELNGFSWQTTRRPDGTVEVLIQHQPQ